MPVLALLIAAVVVAGPPAPAAAPRENLLRGPARCVLRYLDAVRLAGPRAPEVQPTGAIPAREANYASAKRLVAPRALEEVARRTARGEHHPLAPWREAAGGGVLESFQLLAVRRAPRAAAVVTVRERWWRRGADEALSRSVSEYLVGRVDGTWRVIDRRAEAEFEDRDIAGGYEGWFDPPPGAALGPTQDEAQEKTGADPHAMQDVAPAGWWTAERISSPTAARGQRTTPPHPDPLLR
jgi:hypothetical protein